MTDLILEVVRSIRIGRNLERLDTLYILAVMTTILIKLSVFQYAWCEGMKDVFKLSSHRIVTLSGGLTMDKERDFHCHHPLLELAVETTFKV